MFILPLLYLLELIFGGKSVCACGGGVLRNFSQLPNICRAHARLYLSAPSSHSLALFTGLGTISVCVS